MNNIFTNLKGLAKGHDLGIVLGVLMILGVFIIRLHPFILDIFICLSLAVSMLILLVSIYSKKPLDFSSFPSVLLLTTLFRLALNVSSTRNILLGAQTYGESAAGEIIRSFGHFVVGGNFAVGIIIFLILVTINFIVITKGAGRVAEVGARFTLDAMPGKQMAIDADLNAGIIDQEEAKRRRTMVAKEADFYGAMDGASKFVRGDAIAGIIITVINIVGGIIIGVAQYNLDFIEASKLFTLLTVGDGLVTQIPAIIISTAAGIIITRNADDETLGKQVSGQMSLHPKALYAAGAVLSAFILVPGLPKIPFILMGGLLFYAGNFVDKMSVQKKEEERIIINQNKKKLSEKLEDLLNLELVELEVGYGIVNLVDVEQKGDLLERITHIRKQFALDWGIIVPSIRIKDNLELKPGGYSIRIKGVEVAKGELLPDHLLAMDPGNVIEKLDGIVTKEPVFGLPAVWVGEERKDEAQYSGYTVVDLSTIIATHITEIIKSNLHELLGRQEIIKLFENFKDINPRLVADPSNPLPDMVKLGTILKVCQNLLKEGVSIRDMRSILETLAEYSHQTQDSDLLTEHVRGALYRSITERIKSTSGDVPIYTLDKKIEEIVAQNIVTGESGMQVSIDPPTTQRILSAINEKIEEATGLGEKMVILCSPVVRPYFKRLIEKFLPTLTVVGHNEISPEAQIKSLGSVRI
jgi:flagellar biosynthesis protein FlhA